jgi:hypothetical protein
VPVLGVLTGLAALFCLTGAMAFFGLKLAREIMSFLGYEPIKLPQWPTVSTTADTE